MAYSVKQAAKILGISGRTVRRRIERGEIQAEKVYTPTGYEYRILEELSAVGQGVRLTDDGQVEAVKQELARRQDVSDAGHAAGQLLSAVGHLTGIVAQLVEEIRADRRERDDLRTMVEAQAGELERLRTAVEARQGQPPDVALLRRAVISWRTEAEELRRKLNELQPSSEEAGGGERSSLWLGRRPLS